MTSWHTEAIFYHIYPLGMTGAPEQNDGTSRPVSRLKQIEPWVEHIESLGCSAVYIGPLFESSSHGYDTIDYKHVDRRLGTDQDLTDLVRSFHERGIRVILDAVFNHTGRSFPQFIDLKMNGEKSSFKNWFQSVSFSTGSPFGDPFSYEGWKGHLSLVKLNLGNEDVQNHILDAAEKWITAYGIDGLRLDAADCMDLAFLRKLSGHCRLLKNDFYMIGEIVHGDYRQWITEGSLNSVTNYECYKGLYSSHNDRNYFEIAHSLKRQFGDEGIYKDIPLYSFADNHDVNRVASLLNDSRDLYLLYIILFTMPGTPSLYYGSEVGLEGIRDEHSDAPLRPALSMESMYRRAPHPDLEKHIRTLAWLRRNSSILSHGAYRELLVTNTQLVFQREYEGSSIVVILNMDERQYEFQTAFHHGGIITDLLNSETFDCCSSEIRCSIHGKWGRILKIE